MLIAIISVSLAIVIFLCFLLAFKMGLRLGMNASKNITPPPIKTPVQAVGDWWKGKEAKKEDKELKDAFNTVLSYDGDVPKGEE